MEKEGTDTFMILDVDGNGIPELIERRDEYDSNGNLWTYDYSKKKMKFMKGLECGVVFYPKKHAIYLMYDVGYNYWYKVTNGKMKAVAYCYTDFVSEDDYEYEVNGKKTTKAKYNKYVKKLKKGKAVKLKLVKNTQANRNKYLK